MLEVKGNGSREFRSIIVFSNNNRIYNRSQPFIFFAQHTPDNIIMVSVTVVAPADDDPADSGAADADTTAKAENALDSSPKCGDTFLLGWLFKLLGIAN